MLFSYELDNPTFFHPLTFCLFQLRYFLMTFLGSSLDSTIIFKTRYPKPTSMALMWGLTNAETSRRHYLHHWLLDRSFWYITMQGATDAVGHSLNGWGSWGSYRWSNLRSHCKLSPSPGLPDSRAHILSLCIMPSLPDTFLWICPWFWRAL